MKNYIKPSLILIVLIVLGTFVFVGAQQNQNNFNGGGVSISGTTPVAGHVATWASGTALQDGGAAGSGTVTNSGNLVNNNLLLGAGATSVKDYGSSILAPANGGMAVVSTSGQGGFWLPTGSSFLPFVTISGTPLTSNNQVRFIEVVIPYKTTITKMTAIGGSGTALIGDVGIYSADGTTLLANTGAVTYVVNTATTTTITQGTVTLNPGVYAFAYTGTLSTSGMFGGSFNGINFMGNSTAQVGTAANAGTAGVLPSSLGVLTKATTNIFLPTAWCEP